MSSDAALSQFPPGMENDVDRVFIKKPGALDSTNVYWLGIDERFTDVYDIEILRGRSIQATDKEKPYLIINQTAAKAIGVDVGDIVKAWGPDDFRIVGVYKDFHNRSLHLPIRPLLLEFWPSFDYVTVRLRTNNLARTLGDLEAAWREFLPKRPFRYEFVEDYLANFYRDDIRAQRALTTLSVIAIFIACLGLLGLIAFITEMRTKEIGVRRVLGSSSSQLITLLLGDFAKLVALASVLAWPVAYVVVRSWLDNFTYRIDLGVSPFLLGGLLALVVAMATISFQAIRAVNADPVKSLRYE